MESSEAQLIKVDVSSPMLTEIHVVGLFGRYSYDLIVPKGAAGGRLMLLHGDNGAGKTTILSLLWNLLSHADQRGHKTKIARTPFVEFHVDFSDGSRISVTKIADLVGSFDITITKGVELSHAARYEVDADMAVPRSQFGSNVRAYTTARTRMRVQATTGALPLPGLEDSPLESQLANFDAQRRIQEYLALQSFSPVFLADDRNVKSDDEELEQRRERLEMSRFERNQSHDDLVIQELVITLSRVNVWFRDLTLSGQSSGSAGANSIYADVIGRLAADVRSGYQPEQSLELLHKLELIGNQSPRFERLGLVAPFPANRLVESLQAILGAGDSREILTAQILSPYLDSVIARYSALEDAERLIRSLISLINSFLVDKQATFTPDRGLNIETDRGGALSPASLSSGERQLMMLLCTTLLASRDARLFIIDEPELSLGLDWQRQILAGLLELTATTPLQFVVATHSVEIMAAEADSMVRLTRG